MYLNNFGGNPPTGSEGRAQKRLIFKDFFKEMDGDLENKSRLPKSYQLFKCHNVTIHIVYIARIDCSI